MTLLLQPSHEIGATFDATIASELGVLPFSLTATYAGTGIASSEAFGTSSITLRNTLAGAPIPSSEAFGASQRIFPKGAQGTKPSTNDTRTTVTGPEDLSGKKFTNPVLLTGSGLTGTRIVFAKKPTFQDCDASLTDVWFDQNTSNGLADIIGATTTTNVTIRRYTANQYVGDGLNIDGAHVGTITFYNGFQRAAPTDAGLSRVFAGGGVASSEAFGTSAIKLARTFLGTAIPSSEAFGTGDIGLAGAIGDMTMFTVADIGDQIYGTWAPGAPSTNPLDGPETWAGEQIWRAQRWQDLYLDKARDLGGGVVVNFGRSDKTQPPVTVGQITIGTNGIPTDNATGLAITSGYTVASVGSPAVVTCTLNLQCSSLKVQGDPLNNDRLVVTGKVWVVDPNADNSPTLTAFNQTWDSTIGGSALFEFHDCTPALTNVYIFGANVDPAFRFDHCRRLTSTTPFIDGGYFKGASHDVANFGGSTDLYMRHCTWEPHAYIAAFTDPIGVGGLALTNPVKGGLVSAGGNLPAWESGRTYATLDVVTFRRTDWNPASPYASGDLVAHGSWNWKALKNLSPGVTPPSTDSSDSNWQLQQGDDHYYRLVPGSTGTLPASGLNGHNAQWQFYGNLHADLDQGYAMLAAAGLYVFENCFWFRGQHVSVYLEKASKIFFNKVKSSRKADPSAWDGGKDYTGVNPPNTTTLSDLVRGSDGAEWIAIQASGPSNGGAKDPANNANPSYWIRGSAHNIKGRFCISHGNNTGWSNANLDPANGFEDTVFSRDFSFNPVQGGANNDTADGVHVTNKRNHYAWSSATPTANPLVVGST